MRSGWSRFYFSLQQVPDNWSKLNHISLGFDFSCVFTVYSLLVSLLGCLVSFFILNGLFNVIFSFWLLLLFFLAEFEVQVEDIYSSIFFFFLETMVIVKLKIKWLCMLFIVIVP